VPNLIEQAIRTLAVSSLEDVLEWVNREARPALGKIRELINSRMGAIVDVSEDYTMERVVEEVRVDTSAGPVTVTLATAATQPQPEGLTLLVTKVTNDANAVSILPGGYAPIVPGGGFSFATPETVALRYDPTVRSGEPNGAWRRLF
jgi:hypothetical protein